MCAVMLWACVNLLCTSSYANAADPAAAKAVLNEAVRAHGGSSALAKLAGFIRTSSVELSAVPGKAFTVEQTFVLPTKVRNAIKLDGKQLSMMVLNVDKAWQSSGGPAEAAPDDLARELKEENYVIWLSTLAPFTKESFDLDLVPEIKVNGQPAVGVKVTRKDRPDAMLYFDKKTNLLVKIDAKPARRASRCERNTSTAITKISTA